MSHERAPVNLLCACRASYPTYDCSIARPTLPNPPPLLMPVPAHLQCWTPERGPLSLDQVSTLLKWAVGPEHCDAIVAYVIAGQTSSGSASSLRATVPSQALRKFLNTCVNFTLVRAWCEDALAPISLFAASCHSHFRVHGGGGLWCAFSCPLSCACVW
jgi:hypothetical protein